MSDSKNEICDWCQSPIRPSIHDEPLKWTRKSDRKVLHFHPDDCLLSFGRATDAQLKQRGLLDEEQKKPKKGSKRKTDTEIEGNEEKKAKPDPKTRNEELIKKAKEDGREVPFQRWDIVTIVDGTHQGKDALVHGIVAAEDFPISMWNVEYKLQATGDTIHIGPIWQMRVKWYHTEPQHAVQLTKEFSMTGR